MKQGCRLERLFDKSIRDFYARNQYFLMNAQPYSPVYFMLFYLYFSHRYSIAFLYPSNPSPIKCASHAIPAYEICLNFSRSLTSEMCTSQAGMETAFSASSIATLVCVYAAGFMTIPSNLPNASCILSTISPSWFD